MVRRVFVSVLSSLVALAAASPVDATESQEPDPIVVDRATVDRARRVLDAVANGTFDRAQLAPQLNSFVGAEVFPQGAELLKAVGPPQSMYPFEKRILADQTSTYFRVRYAKETLTWVFSVDNANRIVGLSLRRGLSNKIFSVVYRDIQY